MIDEKKLIKELENNRLQYNDSDVGIGINVVKEIINSQPKINRWIPCSERLPEIASSVIVTSYGGHVWDDIDYGYAYETDDKPCFHRWDDENWRCFKPEVIAWMPLPEPYKGEEND